MKSYTFQVLGRLYQSREVFIECGCCSCYHRFDFWGDCRNDSERFEELPENAELVEDES